MIIQFTERPDVVEEFNILNVTESSAEIRWRESFNGNAAIVNYVVEYRIIDVDSTSTSSASVQSSMTITPITSATIPMDRITNNGSMRSTVVSGLRSNTIYNIRLAAQNSIGQSDFVPWVRFRTEQSAPESPPLELSATPTGPNSVKITWKVKYSN